MDKFAVEIAGLGGQGVVTVGNIIAEAAGVIGGRFVSQYREYGPESKGSFCRTGVVISDKPIAYPYASLYNFILVLSSDRTGKYRLKLNEGGLAVLDTGVSVPVEGINCLRIPILEEGQKRCGGLASVNIFALGVITRYLRDIPVEFIWRAAEKSLPENSMVVNKEAFEKGLAGC